MTLLPFSRMSHRKGMSKESSLAVIFFLKKSRLYISKAEPRVIDPTTALIQGKTKNQSHYHKSVHACGQLCRMLSQLGESGEKLEQSVNHHRLSC